MSWKYGYYCTCYLCWGRCANVFTWACWDLSWMLGPTKCEQWHLVQSWAILGMSVDDHLIVVFYNVLPLFSPRKYGWYLLVALAATDEVQAAHPSVLGQILITNPSDPMFALLFVLRNHIKLERFVFPPPRMAVRHATVSIWHVDELCLVPTSIGPDIPLTFPILHLLLHVNNNGATSNGRRLSQSIPWCTARAVCWQAWRHFASWLFHAILCSMGALIECYCYM